jgi:Flp pilus assembly protein TadD
LAAANPDVYISKVVTALNNLAYLYTNMGDTQKAQKYRQKATELENNN